MYSESPCLVTFVLDLSMEPEDSVKVIINALLHNEVNLRNYKTFTH